MDQELETASLKSDDNTGSILSDSDIETDAEELQDIALTIKDNDGEAKDENDGEAKDENSGEPEDDGEPEYDGETDDDEETDDDDDNDALRKLENDEHTNILLNYHPEIKQNNFNEVIAMCDIVRDKNGIICDPLHKTLPWLTKYERARVLGIRAKQLNNGAEALVKVPSSMISGSKIALEELKAKKIPFIIRRPIPNGGTEYWKLEDLELLETY